MGNLPEGLITTKTTTQPVPGSKITETAESMLAES